MSYSASPNHNRAPERRFVGKVALEPSGDHRILLHMDGTPFELDFTEEDARTAIKLLEQGLTQIMWEDNRKSERLNRAVMGIDI